MIVPAMMAFPSGHVALAMTTAVSLDDDTGHRALLALAVGRCCHPHHRQADPPFGAGVTSRSQRRASVR